MSDHNEVRARERVTATGTRDDDLLHKAVFLGPKAENADTFEELLLEVLRDHVFWRRNFHPRDPRLIAERDKRTEQFGETTARLRDELFQILAALKRAAPLYSPRQIAHMVSDPTLPALVGYFAGLLYNQNNVVAEVSPETVREEREYFAALARMVDYPAFIPETLTPDVLQAGTTFSWGHLCSGGTVANLEALWIARNVRLYPLAVRLLAERMVDFSHYNELSVTLATGETAELGDLPTFALSNLSIDEITSLHLRVQDELAHAEQPLVQAFREQLPSVRKAGLAAFLLQYNEAFPDDPARLPRVLVSQAAHYCWEKNMDIIGLGADALELVPVDRHIRLDVQALGQQMRACAAEGRPVLGVISICGTTEEGAVDPLHEIEALRSELRGEGVTFWHHCDAAFGGYLASMLPRDDEGAFVPVEELDDDDALVGVNGLITEAVYRGIAAIAKTDSLTVDPHKFGYVPYPAGAVLFRDYHFRDAISYAAPYLATDERAGFGGSLGQWTLEGSRPGAAAVSCYLSQAMVPLDESGHGRLVKNCIAANRQLVAALEERFADNSLRLLPFAPSETVGFCFALLPDEGVESLEALNAFTRSLWEQISVDGREDINQYEFILSKTDVNVADYRHVLEERFPARLLASAGDNEDATLTLLRTFLINPFLLDWQEPEGSFAERFADYLHLLARRTLG